MDLLLTNHARLLASLARDPAARLRDLAAETALTERAVQRLLRELETAGLLRRIRQGRRNRYEVDKRPLRQLSRTLSALGGPDTVPPPPVMPAALSEAPPARCDTNSREPSFLD